MRLRFVATALVGLSVGGCSILNAPDDIQPGAGGGASATTTTAATGGAGPTTTSTGGGGAPSACENAADCDVTECEDAACDGGLCQPTPKPAGTECGAAGDGGCVAPGRCDGSGACAVPSTEGAPCDSCEGEPATCVCRASVCEVCDSFASENTFADPELVGWSLEGGWGLYTRFPRDRQQADEVPIGKRVLGNDGNRRHPYPGGVDASVGGDVETATATTPTIELPEVLTFLSWHEDEGGAGTGRDNKRIVARSGAIEAVLVDCGADVAADQPFCQPWNLTAQREADDWDEVSIPLPPNLLGLPGTIELEYDSVDANGGRERGWFIDRLDAGGRCRCAANADCAYLDGPCSIGICDTPTGACTVGPRADSEGTACGSADAAACSGPDKCDAFGFCDPRDKLDGTACTACEGGDCQACGEGACVACSFELQTFDGDLPTQGWTLGAGWAARGNVPPSTNPAVTFGSSVFGTLGDATSTAETIETAIPTELTFRSWNVDGGGASGEGNKTITLVTTAGDEIVILDCAGGVNADAPPCQPNAGPRAGSDFDDVTLDAGAAAGEVGTIRFGYEATSPPASAQGWFIDDLNAVRCP